MIVKIRISFFDKVVYFFLLYKIHNHSFMNRLKIFDISMHHDNELEILHKQFLKKGILNE
jgi:hypothetical protein